MGTKSEVLRAKSIEQRDEEVGQMSDVRCEDQETKQ